MGAVPTPLAKRNSWLTRGQHPNKQGQKAGKREVCLRGRGQGSSMEPWTKGRDRKTSEKEAVGGGTQLGRRPIKQNGMCHRHLLFLGPVSLSSC